MRGKYLLSVGLLAAAAVLLQNCAFGSKAAKPDAGLRATNVELRILSQSCFQSEIVPCG